MFGIDLNHFRFTHPLHVMSIISQSMIGNQNIAALDFLLQKEADSLTMKTGGLESLSEQLDILTNLPADQSVLMLKKLLNNLSRTRRSLYKMDELYGKADLIRLYQMSRKGLGAHRKIHINHRNTRLSGRAFDFIKTNNNSCFICCGVAHFWGEFGMLRQLKQFGVKVKPVVI